MEPVPKKAKVSVDVARWKFMSAWFCPYAQRAWIALNHHNVPYDKIEALTLKQQPGETLKDVKGYEKHPLLLKHHPSGLVPTIIDSAEELPAVYDSLTCVLFADDLAVAGAVAGREPLLPLDPVPRARARMWAEWLDKNVCAQLYNILVPKDVERRRESYAKLCQSLKKFQAEIAGPYFLGEHLSIVDIAAIPWCHRILSCRILEHYRGPDFALDAQEFAPLLRWMEVCLSNASVSSTLADKQALIDSYKRYADGTAESKVADAVRSGKNAHQHD